MRVRFCPNGPFLGHALWPHWDERARPSYGRKVCAEQPAGSGNGPYDSDFQKSVPGASAYSGGRLVNHSEKMKIMVVDDHPLMRVGVTSIINARSNMITVAQTDTGEEAITLFRRHKPDVTLMDLRLPKMSGVEAILEIRSGYPKASFVVLTTYEGD